MEAAHALGSHAHPEGTRHTVGCLLSPEASGFFHLHPKHRYVRPPKSGLLPKWIPPRLPGVGWFEGHVLVVFGNVFVNVFVFCFCRQGLVKQATEVVSTACLWTGFGCVSTASCWFDEPCCAGSGLLRYKHRDLVYCLLYTSPSPRDA